MKKISILPLLFLSLSSFAQEKFITKIEILQDPPSIFDIAVLDHEAQMTISQWPEVEAKEITDTFKVYRVCTDNGVSVLHAIRPHGEGNGWSFREGYQIVFWYDSVPAELKEIAAGDCFFFKIKPFYKTNRMPGCLTGDPPIELNGVWISVIMYESSNIYSIEPSSIRKLQSSNCNCESEQKDINSLQKDILDWWSK